MQTKIHINQHNIRANSKGGDLPVITVKDYKRNRKTSGAKVWIETELEVRVSDEKA